MRKPGVRVGVLLSASFRPLSDSDRERLPRITAADSRAARIPKSPGLCFSHHASAVFVGAKRQQHTVGCTVPGIRIHPDASAMGFYQCFDDRESDAIIPYPLYVGVLTAVQTREDHAVSPQGEFRHPNLRPAKGHNRVRVLGSRSVPTRKCRHHSE